MMGGELVVESVLGIGSRFSFELTFELAEEIISEKETPEEIIDEIENLTFNGDVLVCEDNVLSRQVVFSCLQKIGLKIKIATNGKEGLELVEKRHAAGERPFDVILMDIHMPVMDGIEATTRIIEMGVKTPIIALTADVMSDSLELYKSIGIVDVIAKPFKVQELWRTLSAYISISTTTPLANEIKTEPVDNEKILELFVNLEYLLNKSDIKSLNFLYKLKTIPNTDELINLIEKFAFKDALITLKNLKKSYMKEE
jgi:CheY-like chemotaxis protein